MEAVWSRERLTDFVRGKHIYARDARAGTVPAPAWLLTESDGLGPHDTSAVALDHTHPEDRNLLVSCFMDALAAPGEIQRARLRSLDGDRWVAVDVECVSLFDHADVGCMLWTRRVVGEHADGPGPEDEDVGDHRAARWMIMEVTAIGTIKSVRGKVVETLGYRPSQLRGRPITDFLASDTLADGYANWNIVVATPGATSTSRRRWLRQDGSEVWLEASYLNQGSDTILAVFWDITERRAQEQELAELTRQFRQLADEVPAAVLRCDAEGTVLFHNARWADLVAGQPGVTRLHHIVHVDDRPAVAAAVAGLAAGSAVERRVLDVRSPCGDHVWRVALRSAGEGTTVMGSVEDVTAAVRLREEARRDDLTGLLNRPALAEALAAARAEDPAGTTVVFLDLDGFKTVNDVHGHDAGDVVLAEIGRRLTAALRPGDTVGRYGGDEFVVVCRGVDRGDDGALAARLEGALAGPVAFAGGGWEPAASVGTARPAAGEDLAAVIRRADQAMFAAKRRRQERRGAGPSGGRGPVDLFRARA